MEHVRIDDIEVFATNSPTDPAGPISRAPGATGFAMNYFELAPGESFGSAYHRQNNQEEVFYVQLGITRFETMPYPPKTLAATGPLRDRRARGDPTG